MAIISWCLLSRAMFKGFGRSKKKPVLEDNELTTGIVQHPVTKRWQTWISFTGHDIQCREQRSKVRC
ncbi:hypothetical protein [Nostoc commune]|uniref:hypothetical protein n=1 Tax=Nostoc commune TaxID=1178 RepID=UPI0018C6E997|nr:hypothetical protein [Nostoc commune]